MQQYLSFLDEYLLVGKAELLNFVSTKNVFYSQECPTPKELSDITTESLLEDRSVVWQY
jgi:hypothetical protein